MTPLLVSKVSSEFARAHGVDEDDETVNWTDPTISARVPDAPALEKGRLAEKTCPLVTVKLAAVPMIVPVALVNVMVPVQEAAVPLEDAVALLRTLICTVSVLAMPTGGNRKFSVKVVVEVCAEADRASQVVAARDARTDRLKNIQYISCFVLGLVTAGTSGCREGLTSYPRNHWFETGPAGGVFRKAAKVYGVNRGLTFFTLLALLMPALRMPAT